MTISIDFHGCYVEYKHFFDCLANAMQSRQHKVGIITGEREHERNKIISQLGFTPDFVRLWGEYETIANGNLWKAQRMDDESVDVHFDDDAREIKKYTGRWVFKAMTNFDPNKF